MKHFFIIPVLFTAVQGYSQKARNVSTFALFQVNSTTQDRTQRNNSGGFGFGLQAFLNTKAAIKPTLEVNGDFFAGTKDLLLTADGRIVEAKQTTSGIYTGPSFHFSNRAFVAATAGATFYNHATHFGIRPSAGLYVTSKKRLMLKLSHTTVFQRDAISNEPFHYGSFALALKLF